MACIASWNVNSLRVRLPHIRAWLHAHPVDALALQEIKQTTESFDENMLADLGYQGLAFGQKSYNGVAIFSRLPMEELQTHLPDPRDGQARGMAVSLGSLRLINLYVPNGEAPNTDKYRYKLQWLEQLHHYLAEELQRFPRLLVVGDFNIAPADVDVWDAERWRGKILCSDAERLALRKLFDLGFVDSFRQLYPQRRQYSWWDYRGKALEGKRGLRIDLMLSHGLKLVNAGVDEDARAAERSSDHAPAWLHYED